MGRGTRRLLAIALGSVSNMFQDAHVDLVDDRVRPQPPVGGGPKAVLIPSRAFESGATVGERRTAETLRLPTSEIRADAGDGYASNESILPEVEDLRLRQISVGAARPTLG